MAKKIVLIIDSGNGLLSDGTKPLHEPMVTYQQWVQWHIGKISQDMPQPSVARISLNITFLLNCIEVFQGSMRSVCHDDVMKWKNFPRNWSFMRGIHRSPVNSPHKGKWRGALMFSLICAWINSWVNNHGAGYLKRYIVHYDVTVMHIFFWFRRRFNNGHHVLPP